MGSRLKGTRLPKPIQKPRMEHLDLFLGATDSGFLHRLDFNVPHWHLNYVWLGASDHICATASPAGTDMGDFGLKCNLWILVVVIQ